MKLKADAIHFAAQLVGQMRLRGEMLEILEKKFAVDRRTAKALVRAGRRLLLEWSNQPPEEHYVESVAFYRSVIQSNCGMKDKVAARQLLDERQGVERRPEVEDSRALGEAEQAAALKAIEERYGRNVEAVPEPMPEPDLRATQL